MATEPVPARTPQRAKFYERIAPANLAPLWENLHRMVTAEPVPSSVPAIWHYRDVRPHLMESGKLITAQEATRRVLMLMNPGLGGEASITGSLFAGLQLIMPGEIAPAHRHTQSALRFIIEGKGAFTAVDGERTYMRPGDFVITPSWTWHDHGNETSEPMVWLDGLDIPLVMQFGATFREDHRADEAPVTRPEGDALARYGSGLMPVTYRASSLNSPVFNYPYARTREALHAAARGAEPDAHLGHLMRFVNPNDGGWAMPTMAPMIRLLPRGFATRPYRSSDSMVFVCVEGRARVEAGGQVFEVEPRDVFVIPGWIPYGFSAHDDTVLFSYSDRVAHEKLGFFREQRL
jgi:gentisate 1,2-dioxygenase